MTLRLLSGGVDSLYVSIRGGARTALLVELEAAKLRAQHEREPVPFEFAKTGTRMRVKPGGFAGWAYWLTSPELELWLGRDPRMQGPAGRVQFHSLYLHGAGPATALAAVRDLLERDVCAGPSMLSVSRLDVYADAQGWRLEPADMKRFVTWANHRDVKGVGRRFTGFVFGQGGGMMARLYDKDAQMEESGRTWMRSYWRGRVEGERVWRLEFELRRALMRRLEAQEPGAVLELVPALWRRCTSEWLTLRIPSGHAVKARWPVDPMWVEAQGLLGAVQEGRELVWRAAEEASEERVLAVLAGSFTTWAAMQGIEDEERAGRAMVVRTDRYLARTGRTFGSEVRRKRERLLARGVRRAVLSRRVHAPGLSMPGGAVGVPEAQEEESLPRIGRSARTARRARVPEGGEPNRYQERRGEGTRGSGRRRRRVRDGGDGGGSARQRSERTGRTSGGGRLIPNPRRGRGRGPSVSIRSGRGLLR
jgi:hypothetical protein